MGTPRTPYMRFRPQNDTPREIEAKWGGKCKCEKRIEPGDKVMYYPASRKVECMDCSRETREALADERGGL